MKQLTHYTVGDTIDFLSTLPRDWNILGLAADTDSYRGYYDHVAIEPDHRGTTVGELLDELNSKVGTIMTGYKGGEFPYNRGCYVFVANYGYTTGAKFCGFELVSKVFLNPIVLTDSYY